MRLKPFSARSLCFGIVLAYSLLPLLDVQAIALPQDLCSERC